MKVSTAVELLGFACLSVAAFVGFFMWRLAPGFAVTGACLLAIGYGTEDDRAALAVGRMLAPLLVRHALRKQRHAQRLATRRANKLEMAKAKAGR